MPAIARMARSYRLIALPWLFASKLAPTGRETAERAVSQENENFCSRRCKVCLAVSS